MGSHPDNLSTTAEERWVVGGGVKLVGGGGRRVGGGGLKELLTKDRRVLLHSFQTACVCILFSCMI